MIDAMKQALEALDTCHWDYDSEEESYKTFDEDLVNDATEALRQAIEQAEKQEPVAWMFQHDKTGRMSYVSNDGMNSPEYFLSINPRYGFVCALYTAPNMSTKPENIDTSAERVQEIDKSIHEEIERLKAEIRRLQELADYRLQLLMKMPEHKTWVGLTDEEIVESLLTEQGNGIHAYTRAIEAKLRERNT